MRRKDRAAVVTAIELLGELRAREAAPTLVQMLLFGKDADIHDSRMPGKQPPPPHDASPAVAALMKIGVPSLKPLTDRLVAITTNTQDNDTLSLYCYWPVEKILGPELGKEHLMLLCKRDNRAKESEFVKIAIDFMDLVIRVKSEDK